MGCNYYLEKVDGSDWILPVHQIGYVASSGILLVKNNGESTLSLDVDRCTETLKRLHIGKSSAGWHFSLCIYPCLNIYNLDDWYDLFYKDDEYRIVNEYDEQLDYEEMTSVIIDRCASGYLECKTSKEYEDSIVEESNKLEEELARLRNSETIKQYHSYDDILKENNAERGFNGLWSHKSNIWDCRKEQQWKGYVPMISTYIRTDGTYDLTPDWDFS